MNFFENPEKHRRLYMKGRKTILLLFLALLMLDLNGQTSIQDLLPTLKKYIRFKEVDQFYQLNNYQPAWQGKQEQVLLDLLQQADYLGLNEKDYQYNFISQLRSGVKNISANDDNLEADIRCTDAALHFFTELKTGNRSPALSYNGLKYQPYAGEIPSLVRGYAIGDRLPELVDVLQPHSKEFRNMLNLLSTLIGRMKEPGFKETKITSSKINTANKPLLQRLYQFGIIDTVTKTFTDKELVLKIKQAQKLFDVLNDGKLRSTILKALNIPLRRRVEELKLALNYLRWLDQLRQSSAAILNIPSTFLTVYDKGELELDSKVIVGKQSTPTPTLSSTITEVILYPYWMVPYKIATRELLPSIKRNIGFIESGNYEVLNKQGRRLDPYAINWHSLSTSYFPYIIRQSTGCDNALGVVKFNFYNPFTVYLHDTPSKSLFTLNKRYFSHGCMRVEKPLDFAHIVLGSNRIAIDTLTERGCLDHQSPLVVPVEKELPVVILYSTAWYTRDGDIKFYDDVYEKLSQLLPRIN